MSQPLVIDQANVAFPTLPNIGETIGSALAPLLRRGRTGRAVRVLATGLKLALAPLLGLAFVLALPFAGLAALFLLRVRASIEATA